ncbi:MAG: sulfite exporter TauE/SafE family protein [Clostridia bacterium]|nr:sulfite exporter TauE/SafE family protein [Clostridia bacterium]
MIYLILSGVSAFLGLASGLGPTTLLRPLLDAVSPLPADAVSILCSVATLSSVLVIAFFALSEPLTLHPDELILLAVGSAIGGVLGDLAASRFLADISRETAALLNNALLFVLLALPAVYFHTLSASIRPFSLTRLAALPCAFVIGLFASFLSFGAEPLTLLVYFLLFDAEHHEASTASLTIALCAMCGKLVCALIRTRLNLPHADILLWLLPGAVIGALFAVFPAISSRPAKKGDIFLKLSLFTSLINMAAALT